MPPPNNSAATATDLGTLPATLSVDVSTGLTNADRLWYRHTAVAGEGALSFTYYAAGLALNAVFAAVFTGPLPTPPDHLSISTGRGAVQFPVTAGETYYIELSVTVSWPALVLDLAMTAGPNGLAPVGSIAVPDDTEGFPLVIHAATTGAVLQFRKDFPSGEEAAILSNGRGLFDDGWNETYHLYDETLTRLAILPYIGSGSSSISSNGADRFYVGDSGGGGTPARITTFDGDGVQGPTTWILPQAGLTRVIPNPAETIAYIHGQASGAGAIQRWDLVNSVLLSNPPITVPSGFLYAEFLVLPDDTLLVAWQRSSPRDAFVEHINPVTGAVLFTYPLWTNTDFDHLWLDPDGVSFWAWLHLRTPDNGRSRFERRRVTDGVVLSSATAVQYEAGNIQRQWTPSEPRHGHSFSCPFVILPYALAAVEEPIAPPGPSYHIEARYIRRLRRAPHVANDNKRVFYRSFELDLERGVGLATGQGSDPIVQFRLSRDGGHTWSEPLLLSAGALGAYTSRAIARRLGSARDAVFEVTVADPVAWSLVQAWLDLEAGTH